MCCCMHKARSAHGAWCLSTCRERKPGHSQAHRPSCLAVVVSPHPSLPTATKGHSWDFLAQPVQELHRLGGKERQVLTP